MTTEITKAVAEKVLATVDVGLVYGVGVRKPGEMCVEAAVCFALDLPHGDDPVCVSRALRSLKINLNDKAWSNPQARAKGLRRLALVQLGSRGMNDVEFVQRLTEMTIRKVVPAALRTAVSLLAGVLPEHAKKLEDAAGRCEAEGTASAASNAASAASAASDAARYAASNAASDAARAASNAASDARYAASNAASDAASNAASDAASNAASDAARAASYAASAASAAASDAARAASYDGVLSWFAEEVVSLLVAMKVPGVQWLSLT